MVEIKPVRAFKVKGRRGSYHCKLGVVDYQTAVVKVQVEKEFKIPFLLKIKYLKTVWKTPGGYDRRYTEAEADRFSYHDLRNFFKYAVDEYELFLNSWENQPK